MPSLRMNMGLSFLEQNHKLISIFTSVPATTGFTSGHNIHTRVHLFSLLQLAESHTMPFAPTGKAWD